MSRPDASSATAGTKNRANITAVIGASGTGKSSFIKGELLKKYSRLFVWSPLEETDDYRSFCNGVVATRMTEFVNAVKNGERAVVFVPSGTAANVKTQFDQFCRVVWLVPGAHVLVEELSQVTMPSWAPPAWKKLSSAGRHKGLVIIGASQRPASIDKDFLGNCTEVRCYRVNYDADAKVMADSLNLPTVYETDPQTKKPKAIKGMDQIRKLPNFNFFHKNPDLSIRRGVNKSL